MIEAIEMPSISCFSNEGATGKVVLRAVAVALALTALAKFHGATTNAEALTLPDPVFRLSFRLVLVAAGLLELGVVAYLLFGGNAATKWLLVLWLCAQFILYRMARWWVEPGSPCPCLGVVAEKWPRKAGTLNWGINLMLAFMVFSSLFFLMQAPVAAVVGRLGPRARSRLKLGALATVSLLLCPHWKSGMPDCFAHQQRGR